MKKIFLSIFFFSTVLMLHAQVIDKSSALNLVKQQSKSIGLSADDVNNLRVNDAYNDKQAGNVTMIYLQQMYKGIPVHNQMQVLAFKNNQLMSNAGGRLPMEKIASRLNASPSVSAESALYTALSSKKVNATQSAVITNTSANGQRVTFNDLGATSAAITAELMWAPLQDGKSVCLSWEIHFMPKGTSDDWLIRINAASGEVVGIDNLTVYCNWDDPEHAAKHNHQELVNLDLINEISAKAATQPAGSNNIVNGASFLVVPFPAESPIHPGGTPAVRTDPWTMAPGNATTLKWNSDGTNDYNTTRGNNVRAYEDRGNTASGGSGNAGTGLAATSTTSDPLTFQFAPTFTVTPTQTTPVQNQQFNITNLFYWNNIIHDLTYQYGFDEVSGNFQVNNQGRGGLGNDPVLAEAQDGGGTNNANFNTPNDGTSGRMQMYLWSGNPQKDGDVDNGVIVHEHGHGISNRLTGGPGNSSCLQNAEQMGEGWSDYYGLMYTQDWSTATLTTGFDSPRGIGTYVLGQTAAGLGIRSQRYCTNFSVNNKVYAASIPAAPHDRGEIWCATLWDMTWNIINQVGTINPNMFNPAGGGGNTIALRLVTEGMKLQPCSPGFISGRDGILAADQLLYGGQFACAIKEAFRRRGMGDGASQGSSNSVTDQIPSFAGGLTLKLSENIVQVQEGQNIIYTNLVTTCSAVSNYLLTDTLPANVTYVSGGTYNAATRVVSFPVTLANGGSQSYVFTVNVNAGSYFPPVDLLNETVAGTTIPASWTATATTGPSNWVVSQTQTHSAPNSFFAVDNNTAITDFNLATTNAIALDAVAPTFSFWHNYNTEATWDGGVVEISTNGGATYTDLGPNMFSNGYNSAFATGTILANRAAFTGTSNGWVQTQVNMEPYINQNIKIRFRALSDDNTSNVGWYIDDILLQKKAQVKMRSSLFNASGVRINTSDTLADIIQSSTCIPVAISTQPVATSACSGNNATISVAATASSPTYQWQVSTDNGANWGPVAGATAATLTLNAVTTSMNGNQYRAVISNACPSSITSDAVVLTVSASASINAQPQNASGCVGTPASFTVGATGSTLTYQWQVSTDNGVTWTDISGATAATYTIASVASAQNNNQYRAVVFSCGPTGTNSAAATLTVSAAVNITTQPSAVTVCENANATFTAAATGSGVAYQWQVSTNNGGTWSNIAGQTATTLTLTNVSTTLNNNQYRVVVTGTCSPSGVNSNAAILTVNTLVTISAQPQPVIICAGLNASFSVTAAGTGLAYQWQVSTNNGAFTDIPGATTNTLSLTNITVAMNGNQYRAVLNGTCTPTLNSNTVLLTVNTPVVLTTQPPATIEACAGSSPTIGVTATGTSITYQWQYSVNNGPFVNISNGTLYSGATTATLTLNNVSTTQNGYRFQVVANGVPCGGVTSSFTTLTVNPTPVVELTAASYPTYNPNVYSELYTTVSPLGSYTYQWYKNNDLISVTGPRFRLTGDDFGEYYVIATNANGCSDMSNRVTVKDSASSILFIYPNPSSGQFQVRYYNQGGATVTRKLVIYDEKGSRVYVKEYTITGAYGRMDVTLRIPGAGTYIVELLDANSKRLATGRLTLVATK